MADITYNCPKCNATRMVSEFADPDKILCSACEVKMTQEGEAPIAPPPQPSPNTAKKDAKTAGQEDASPSEKTQKAPKPSPAPQPKAGKNKLKLARERAPEPVEKDKSDKPEGKIKSKKILEPEETRAPLELHPKKKARKKKGVSHTIWAFLVFAVIGSASSYGYLQFRHTYLQPVIPYFWIGVLAMHILVTLKALSNDMMQGILCLLVPGWSIFYLVVCDNYYYKAVIFGLLMGIGFDGGSQLMGYIMNILGSIQNFINSGGGETRQLSGDVMRTYFYT